ncbi:hypothetical protein TIFTF001_038265 [Ficus carica]|uniref:Uncharacterized protein n=1 Tax=Ficus carica TaxID=3494 RepID=A0AA88JCS2_FICCA|nr:hypothetical protein TIFTF001_038265 [Ficus carica]
MDCSSTAMSTLVATSSDTSSSVATPPSTLNERSAEIDGMYNSDSEYSSGDEELSDNEIEKVTEKDKKLQETRTQLEETQLPARLNLTTSYLLENQVGIIVA